MICGERRPGFARGGKWHDVAQCGTFLGRFERMSIGVLRLRHPGVRTGPRTGNVESGP